MMRRVLPVFRPRTAFAAAILLVAASLLAAAGLTGRSGAGVPAALAAEEPAAAVTAGIAGKIVFEGKPLPGARVHVFRDAASSFKGKGFAASKPVGADGVFSIPLPPGSYYLVAKMGRPSATGAEPPLTVDAEGCHCPFSISPDTDVDPPVGGFFGYFGANPITVQEGRFTERTVQVVRRAPFTIETDRPGNNAVIEGALTGPAGPVSGGTVYLYTDASRQFRGPDLFGPQGAVPGGTGERGEFSAEVPPGTYYLVAAKRQGGALLGPLQLGDLQGYFDGNPLTVAAGTRTSVVLQAVGKQRDTSPVERAAEGRTGIRGKILGPDGPPPTGVYAFATTDPSFMIGAMPPYRSQPIGPDGSFFIDVPAAGTYYVSARSGYGGPPLPGEWHGFHGGGQPTPVIVEGGRVTAGIVIVVKKME